MTIQTITWEDSNIEINAVEEIKKSVSSNHFNFLMSATSGDTIIELLDQFPEAHLICLSEKSRNLAVLELKIKLIIQVPDPNIRLAFLDGTLSEIENSYIYHTQLKPRLISHQFWDQNLNMIETGIHLHDKFIKLFHSKNFCYRQLIKVFGSKVIINSLSYPYPKYLSEVIKQHEEHNIFSHYGPNYLQSDPVRLNSAFENRQISFIHQDLFNYLHKTHRRFHLISLQTDQYSQSELISLLNLIRLRMVPISSRLILRRINSDYPLHHLVNKFFIVLDLERDFLTDRTYLYREVILATPRPIF